MAKGKAALSYLPEIKIVSPSGDLVGIESFKAVLNKIARYQEEEAADTTDTSVPCLMENPFSSTTWDITISGSGAVYTIAFDAEELNTVTTIGRPALATRRSVDIEIETSAFTFTVRSALAVIGFVEKLEDRVAKSGNGATGDATYTTYTVKGITPFESYDWTVVKSGAVYTITPVAAS